MQTQTTVENSLNDWLQICDRNLGKVPRSFKWIDRLNYLPMRQPAWAKTDPLHALFQNQNRLLERGKLVWGSIVQANTALFIPGRDSCPASVVFSADRSANFDPEILREISRKIFKLKGTEPTDPQLLKVANHLTDEYDRSFGLFVPSSFCLNIACEISTIYIDRKHLPNGYLSRSLLPLIASPESPKIAMILPSKFWPPAMLDWWLG